MNTKKAQIRLRDEVKKALQEGGAMSLGDLGQKLSRLKPPVTAKSVGRSKLSAALQSYCNDLVELVDDGEVLRVRPLESTEIDRVANALRELLLDAPEGLAMGYLGNQLREKIPSFEPKAFGVSKFSELVDGPLSKVVRRVAPSSQKVVLREKTASEPPQISVEQTPQYSIDQVQAALVELVSSGKSKMSELRTLLGEKLAGFQPQMFGYGSMKTLIRGKMADTFSLEQSNQVLKLKKVTPVVEPKKPEGLAYFNGDKTEFLTKEELWPKLRALAATVATPAGVPLNKVVSIWSRHIRGFKSYQVGYDKWDGIINGPLGDQFKFEYGKVYLKAETAKKIVDSKALTAAIKKALDGQKDGIPLSALGQSLREQLPDFTPQDYGFTSLKGLIKNSYRGFLVLHQDKVSYAAKEKSQPKQPSTAREHSPRIRRDKVYELKNAKVLITETLLEELADTALPEPWEFANDPYSFSILKDYLRAALLQSEAQGQLILDSKNGVGAFHTGLMNRNCEDLYAYLSYEGDLWEVRSFCLPGQGLYGKIISRSFATLPNRPQFYDDPSQLVYHGDRPPQIDWNHLLIDRVGRIPVEVLRLAGITVEGDESFLKDLTAIRHCRAQLRSDAVAHRRLKSIFEGAIDQSLRRLQYDFRLCVPIYRVATGTLSLALPLDLTSANHIDSALILESLGDKGYLGHTIYPTRWVYTAARSLFRPTVAWLDPSTLPPVPKPDLEEEHLRNFEYRAEKEHTVAGRESLWGSWKNFFKRR